MVPSSAQAVSLLLFSLHFATYQCQYQPCLVPGISQDEFEELLNPRASADQAVLLNLPFSRLFCSPSVTRYLVVGNWSQRHQLQLDSAEAYAAGSGGLSAVGKGWRVTDVTEASSVGAFDFLLMPDGALSPNAGYFAALTACNPQFCRSVGSARFQTAAAAVEGWSLTLTIGVSVGGGGLVVVIVIIVVVAVAVARRRPPKDTGGKAGAGGGQDEPGRLADDRPDAIGARRNEPYTYLRPDKFTRGPEPGALNKDDDGVHHYDELRDHDAPPDTITMSTFAPAAGVSNGVEPPMAGSLPADNFQNHCYPGGNRSIGFELEEQLDNEASGDVENAYDELEENPAPPPTAALSSGVEPPTAGSLPEDNFPNPCYPSEMRSLGFEHGEHLGNEASGSTPAEVFDNPYYPNKNNCSFGVPRQEQVAPHKNPPPLGSIDEIASENEIQ